MLLESLQEFPEEKVRLRKAERFFEWSTWLILGLSYFITYLPLGVHVNRIGVNFLFGFVAITTIYTYRIMPFEKTKGFFRYTFKLKGFEIGLSDHLFGSAAILFTGGIDSPFWFIYILALIAGSLYLPAWAMVVEGVEAIGLYLVTVAFFAPLLFGYYSPGFTAKMVVVPIAAFFSILLTYVVARDLNEQVRDNKVLLDKLQKKAVEAIGERDKLSSIIKSVSDGIFALDQQKKFVFLNKAAEQVFGVKETDLLGKKFDEGFLVSDATGKRFDSNRLFPSRGSTKEDIVVFGPADIQVTRAGVKSFIRLTSTEIANGEELGIGSICVFVDIKKEKELEDMKIDFVSMAAHELRTPLTSVRGYLAILMEELSEKKDKERKELVEKAFIASTSLSSLVENLLSISNIEKGSLKLSLTKIDWSGLLRESMENISSQAKQKNINLSWKIEGSIPKVLVDRFRISEVLANLLSNAVSYTAAGGSVEVRSYIEKGELLTSVKDTGEGIPKGAIPHLFTKFFRVSGLLEQGSKGTGLGLYISKSIIDMHKGKIWAESKVGKGSTFYFSLPLG